MEHPGRETRTTPMPETPKARRNEIRIRSEADRWIQAKQAAPSSMNGTTPTPALYGCQVGTPSGTRFKGARRAIGSIIKITVTTGGEFH